jgi:transglutaminase-like putative cysteine protease
MLKINTLLIICSLTAIIGCSENHLINNRQYLSLVDSAFAERQQLTRFRTNQLFSDVDKNQPTELSEAFRFMIAFSPLNDIVDYTGEFFLSNIKVALRARNEAKWGKTIPEEIFLHYVLPWRVNNENLDSFRIAYYAEIKNRVNGLDAKAAALEINHWCHEKVSYQPSDIRTSSPMSTILSARGRCGEESTFTVAALRTAGIPARQVYTPRWAHSDDNHAWVEVWIDGKWFYMGACEPEPVLDRGWFTEPARRAMLIHTKSFGAYTEDENAVLITKNYSEINNLSKYAITKVIVVKVLDSLNFPAKDAVVEYQLYNYAEFYPLAMVPTDINGLSKFETGLGDLLIWARKGKGFNFKHISVNEVDTIVIKLDRKADGNDIIEMDLGVPLARSPYKGPGDSLVAANNRRTTEENNIRQKYIETWMKPDEARELAERIGADSNVVKDLISKSMGNYRNISVFLKTAPVSHLPLALGILTVIADKDLRDTRVEVLNDHLNNIIPLTYLSDNYTTEIFRKYILNPRIANEILSPWRGFLLQNLPGIIKSDGINDPKIIISYLDETIKLADNENYYKTPITPRGVLELKVSDSFSRDICFVAICRSLGIPSRLEPGSNMPQYFSDKGWHDALFSNYSKKSQAKGFLKLSSDQKNPVPEYYTHFTLAHFDNGRYNTLDFDYNKRVTDFENELALSPGHYMIVTGNRISDNKILSDISFFTLKENEHKSIKIKIRKDISPAEILGRIDLRTKIQIPGKGELRIDSLIKTGAVFSWIEPDKETTKHILNDLPLLRSELDNWGGYFIFLTEENISDAELDVQKLKVLPRKSLFATDKGSEILKQITDGTPLSLINRPYIILVDKNGNIIFRSEGYRIGIGDQILKKVR